MHEIRKYPRTEHLEGSRRQPGDEDLASVPFAALIGRRAVVEEKLDGANAAVSFDPTGELLLQSRGHFLVGGPRERHFDLFKAWATCHRERLWSLLGSRFVMYGEWLYAKHTIFYDALPHYFLEFDILDSADGTFLSTDRRRELLRDGPVIPVPVLRSGELESLESLHALLGLSRFRTPNQHGTLRRVAAENKASCEQVLRETDPTDLMEGLYIKVEEGGTVRLRLKNVRASLLTAVLDSGSHWLDRPIIPNQLRAGVDLWPVRP